MELEVSSLRKRYAASKEHSRKMKAEMREQSDQTFKVISQFVQVLEEKESQIQEFHVQRESELFKLSQKILILQANMLKERKQLTGIISDLSAKVSSQESEINDLKERLSAQTPLREESPTSDLDTLSPSSEESSPKSRLSKDSTDINNKNSFESIISSAKSPSGKPPIPSRVGVNRKISYRLKELRMTRADEGFFSSHEEPPFHPRNSPHPSAKRTMSFQHDPRVVKSISNFGALEELNVTSASTGQKTPTTIIRYLDYL